jgi:hypothetical protein
MFNNYNFRSAVQCISVGQSTKKEIHKYCIKSGERNIQRKTKKLTSHIPKDFMLAVEDKSIFIHDTLIRRRMWTPEGIRPIVTVTGSHQKTCVFGTITRLGVIGDVVILSSKSRVPVFKNTDIIQDTPLIDGKQLFRRYDVFNQNVFLKYLKALQRKFRKLLLSIDRAAQHCSSIMIRKHLEENKEVIRVAGPKEKMIF